MTSGCSSAASRLGVTAAHLRASASAACATGRLVGVDQHDAADLVQRLERLEVHLAVRDASGRSSSDRGLTGHRTRRILIVARRGRDHGGRGMPGATSGITKRRFLQLVTLGAAASVLAACGPAAAPAARQPAAQRQPAAAKPAAPAAAAQATPRQPPRRQAAKPTAAPAAAKTGGTFTYAEAGDFNNFNPWNFSAVNFEHVRPGLLALALEGRRRQGQSRTWPSPGRWRPTTCRSR